MTMDLDHEWLALPRLTADTPAQAVPALAAQWRGNDKRTVCVLDVPQADGTRLHWLDSAHACGWIEPATGVTAPQFAAVFIAAVAAGFTGADAAMLASTPGATPGQLPANARLPRLSWGRAPRFATARVGEGAGRALGLYGLVDSASRMREALEAGLRTVQLRLKTPAQPDVAWPERLRREVADCVALAREAGAELFVNDHWRLAAELGAPGVHLGQEDLQALGDDARAELVASGIGLGISSHSLWELCRARALAPRYIACGPVWATTTKDMPWIPQGLDNLAWWVRHAGVPVVAIGGILAPQQALECARQGADGVCVVRGLGEDPHRVVPAFDAALAEGRAGFRPAGGEAVWPHPMLPRP